MIAPQINYDDPNLWQHLSIIIDEFEKAALLSETRDGILVTAHGPLEALDQVLEGSQAALESEQWGSTSDPEAKISFSSETSPGSVSGSVSARSGGGGGASASASAGFSSGVDASGKLSVPSAKVGFDIGADADFAAAFPDGSVGDKIAEAMESCVGCDLRLQFRWQLQPIDLLGSIAALLDDINSTLDALEVQINPFGNFQYFCDMANEFKMFCMPDLVIMLMSLKLLIRKYLAFSIEIKLDWSVILGPLLKLITQIIASLVTAIVSVLVAPIDCAIAVVESLANMVKQMNAVAAAAAAAGQSVAKAGADVKSASVNEKGGTPIKGITTSVEASVSADGATSASLHQMKLPKKPKGADKKAVTGVDLKAQLELPKAARKKEFLKSHWAEKMLAGLVDARKWVTDLDKKLQTALGSLNALVGGGLSIQLGNLGLLLLIKDMIGLVVTIVSMINQMSGRFGGAKEIDFCELIQNEPELLRPHLERVAGRAARGVTLVPEGDGTDEARIALYRGPKLVGAIPTCTNKRAGTPEGVLLAQWIAELNRSN